jgi:hypothetical protein
MDQSHRHQANEFSWPVPVAGTLLEHRATEIPFSDETRISVSSHRTRRPLARSDPLMATTKKHGLDASIPSIGASVS